MNREQVIQFIAEKYQVNEEHLWARYPNYAIFRRKDNRKWFAVIMDIPYAKLDPEKEGIVDVLDIKCDPLLIGSLRKDRGFYPAYHMNKANWITIVLDGSVEEEKIKWLLNVIFTLTAKK